VGAGQRTAPLTWRSSPAGVRPGADAARPPPRAWRRRSRAWSLGPRTTGDGFRLGAAVWAERWALSTPPAPADLRGGRVGQRRHGEGPRVRMCHALGSGGRAARAVARGRRVLTASADGPRPLLGRALGTGLILTRLPDHQPRQQLQRSWSRKKDPGVNLAASLECSRAVTERLPDITGTKRSRGQEAASELRRLEHFKMARRRAVRQPGDPAGRRAALAASGPAPEFRTHRTGQHTRGTSPELNGLRDMSC